MTKEEAERLTRENEDLKRRIAVLEGRGPTPTATRDEQPMDATLYGEELYQEIRRRLAAEAPALLRVLTVKPEIEVKVTRKVIEMDEEKPIGRVGKLVAGGFFDRPISPNAAHVELQRLGRGTSKPNVYKICDDLAAMGFLTKEADGFKAVPGMKINIVEA